MCCFSGFACPDALAWSSSGQFKRTVGGYLMDYSAYSIYDSVKNTTTLGGSRGCVIIEQLSCIPSSCPRRLASLVSFRDASTEVSRVLLCRWPAMSSPTSSHSSAQTIAIKR
jgi:hypothetical protein